MLSPGTLYQTAPKDVGRNLLYRDALLARADANKRVRDSIIDACRHDLLWYVNLWVWTYDPRKPQKLIPFITWPFQDKAFLEILDCVEQGRDLVIEKSRDMGASWMSLTVMEWLWHFHRGNTFLMVSRKEDLVDSPGDPDSLFWKVDFIHRNLPDWLRPKTDRRKLHFGNSDNGSTIDGESTTAAAGVGGRRTAMFIDEFSRIEEGYQLLAGTADTTRCRIFNFTPWGTSNAAYKLARRGDLKKLRLHWSEHPEKAAGLYRYDAERGMVDVLDQSHKFTIDYRFVLDGKLRSPWYDAECVRRANDREVAQMLDINYEGSSYQFFDKSLITKLQQEYACSPFWEGDVDFDPDTGRPFGLVKGEAGLLKLWCPLDAQDRPPEAVYAAAADVSTGTGATNSCLTVIDVKTGEKVAEYAAPYFRADQFALRTVAVCSWFRDKLGDGAKVGWENVGPGGAFGKRLMETGYRNVYYKEKNPALPSSSGYSDTPGWMPTNENKRAVLEEYRSALASKRCINRSHIALEECLYFIINPQGHIVHAGEFDRDDPSGARVNHGDRVIADALAWRVAKSLGGGKVQVRREAEPEVAVGSLAWRRQLHEERAARAAAY